MKPPSHIRVVGEAEAEALRETINSTLGPATSVRRIIAERAQNRADAKTAALEVLSFATEAAARLRDLGSLGGDICPAVADGAPRLADAMDTAIARMAFALKNGAFRP